MPQYIDQLKRKIFLSEEPTNIISLVPSITELLDYFQLDKKVVGITKFCEHPSHWRKEKTIVGGTKMLKPKIIERCNPELIIANKEENNEEEVTALMEKYPVWVSDVKNFQDGLDLIQRLGAIFNRKKSADELINSIVNAKSVLDKKNKKAEVFTAAYLIWEKPMMVAGGDTYINDMIAIAGGVNIFKDRKRYPTIAEEELKKLNPDFIFLSSEPFPFKQKHLEKYQSICPTAVIKLVDGTYFSWYGSRMLPAMKYFLKFRD